MTNPFENDEFWEAAAPAIFSETRWESAPQEADGILSLLQPASGATVLDLYGRSSNQVQRSKEAFEQIEELDQRQGPGDV